MQGRHWSMRHIMSWWELSSLGRLCISQIFLSDFEIYETIFDRWQLSTPTDICPWNQVLKSLTQFLMGHHRHEKTWRPRRYAMYCTHWLWLSSSLTKQSIASIQLTSHTHHTHITHTLHTHHTHHTHIYSHRQSQMLSSGSPTKKLWGHLTTVRLSHLTPVEGTTSQLVWPSSNQ